MLAWSSTISRLGMSGGPGGERQPNAEHGAGSGSGLDRDRAVMIADDPLDDGESQPASLGLGGEPGYEQLRALLAIESGTVVGDRDCHHVTVDTRRDRDPTGLRARGERDARARRVHGRSL